MDKCPFNCSRIDGTYDDNLFEDFAVVRTPTRRQINEITYRPGVTPPSPRPSTPPSPRSHPSPTPIVPITPSGHSGSGSGSGSGGRHDGDGDRDGHGGRRGRRHGRRHWRDGGWVYDDGPWFIDEPAVIYDSPIITVPSPEPVPVPVPAGPAQMTNQDALLGLAIMALICCVGLFAIGKMARGAGPM
jgi:hypothetical protein